MLTVLFLRSEVVIGLDMDEVGNTFNQLSGFIELKQIGDKRNPFKRRFDFWELSGKGRK